MSPLVGLAGRANDVARWGCLYYDGSFFVALYQYPFFGVALFVMILVPFGLISNVCQACCTLFLIYLFFVFVHICLRVFPFFFLHLFCSRGPSLCMAWILWSILVGPWVLAGGDGI